MKRHSERRQPYEFDPKTKYDAKERAKNVCEGCGVPASKAKLEVDHVIPIFFSLKYPVFALEVIKSLANARVLCRECHKKRMHYEESEIMLLAWGVLQQFIALEKEKKWQKESRRVNTAIN